MKSLKQFLAFTVVVAVLAGGLYLYSEAGVPMTKRLPLHNHSGTGTGGKINLTTGVTGTLPLANIPNTLTGKTASYAEDLTTLVDLATDVTGSLPWGAISGKPTTVSGYGITDGATANYSTFTPVFTNLTLNGGCSPTYPVAYRRKVGSQHGIYEVFVQINCSVGSTSSTDDSTYFSESGDATLHLAYAPNLSGIVQVIKGLSTANVASQGLINSQRIYTGAWTNQQFVYIKAIYGVSQ